MTRLPADPAPEPQALEARVASLEATLREVTARLAALEGRPPVAAPAQEAQPAPSPMEPLAMPELPSGVGVMSQIGKICLILGGGFFIRGLVDAGKLPSAAGAALGLVYALTWALIALRRQSATAASFDTMASILMAYPLLMESTVRFKILPPGATAALLLVTVLVHATAAWRRELRAIGWISTFAALGTGLLLMGAAHALEPFLSVLFIVALGLLWLATDARWEGLRWPAALAVDLGVVVVAVLATWDGGPPEAYKNLSPTLAMGFALLLVLSYVGTFAWRMLKREARAGVFEWTQTILVLLTGLGGALRVASSHGGGAVGALAVLGGLGCYAASRSFTEAPEETRRNFTYFGLLAMTLLILGGLVLAPTTLFAVLAGAVGFAAMFMAQRLRRTVLLAQSALYLVAAGTASGLFAWTFRAYLGPQGTGGAPTPGALWVLLALAGSVAFFMVRGSAADFQSRIRPVLLTQGALAALSRRAPSLPVKWLVYPMLALATLKFLMEDMAVGHALTLFPAFMFLGATFILAPRLMKVNS